MKAEQYTPQALELGKTASCRVHKSQMMEPCPTCSSFGKRIGVSHFDLFDVMCTVGIFRLHWVCFNLLRFRLV